MNARLHLVDLLAQARIEAPRAEYVQAQPFIIDRDARLTLFQHPDSRATFRLALPGTSLRLLFGIGIKPSCWERMNAAVRFLICLQDGAGRETGLFDQTLDPRGRPEDRCWQDHEIAFDCTEGGQVELTFRTELSGSADGSYCWAGWSDPAIAFPAPVRPPKPRRTAHPNLLLITADALSDRYLGCSGSSLVATPHLDALARDGVRFAHARTQSSSTLSAYVSLLTGRTPLGHRVLSEWGRLPAALPTLPGVLKAAGFRTTLATSEAELAAPELGFDAWFDEVIPALAQPAQDGGTTTRRYLERIDRGPAGPSFTWLEYFDTHPPALPPRPFSLRLYPGDPRSPERRGHPEKLLGIHGVESCVSLDNALPRLAAGVVDRELLERIKAAAAGLREVAAGTWPDIVTHIRNLGPPAWNGLPLPVFADWLSAKAGELERGVAAPDFVSWARGLRTLLEPVDADILSWLADVVDGDYPFSQHLAAIAFLDHQVGTLVEALKERGLYEATTIAFTAPHGESFGTRGITYHHHALLECCLRVPLLVKPARTGVCGHLSGLVLGGVFDAIDLFPTLLEMHGVALPGGLEGRSRVGQMVRGEVIPSHDSFCVDMSDVMRSIHDGRYKLVLARGDHRLSSDWDWRAGETRLFDTAVDVEDAIEIVDPPPGLRKRLLATLEEWGR